MGNYGKAAVKAVRLIAKGKRKTAPDAWNASTIALFGVDTASQKNHVLELPFSDCVSQAWSRAYQLGITPNPWPTSLMRWLQFAY